MIGKQVLYDFFFSIFFFSKNVKLLFSLPEEECGAVEERRNSPSDEKPLILIYQMKSVSTTFSGRLQEY